MNNILVPVGSSNNAVSNLQYAIDLAKEIDGKVYMVSVFKEMSNVGSMAKANKIIREDSENRLEEVLSQVDKKGIQVIPQPIKGSVLEGIERFNASVPMT